MTLEDMIREAVAAGSQVHVWPEPFTTSYRASVRSSTGKHHSSNVGPDAIVVLRAALTEDDRKRRDAPRAEAAERDPDQLELPVAASADDDLDAMLG